jgi:hypothetical protein
MRAIFLGLDDSGTRTRPLRRWHRLRTLKRPVLDLSMALSSRTVALQGENPVDLESFCPISSVEWSLSAIDSGKNMTVNGPDEAGLALVIGAGGGYGDRASKAALSQIVRTAAIELVRRNRQALCVAPHPGTVDAPLSQPFAKAGLNVRSPSVAAGELRAVLHGLTPALSGGFFDYRGQAFPW